MKPRIALDIVRQNLESEQLINPMYVHKALDSLDDALNHRDQLLEVCEEMYDLLMGLTPLVYHTEVKGHLPYGLDDRVKKWLGSTEVNKALAKGDK